MNPGAAVFLRSSRCKNGASHSYHKVLPPEFVPPGLIAASGQVKLWPDLSRFVSPARAALCFRGTQPAMSWLTGSYVLPISLLIASNVFMTIAWYGHLNFKSSPLWLVVFVSWGIAFIEYCLAVPANRIGHAVYSAAELKTIQEVITLLVFAGFSVLVLKEPLGWNHVLGFSLIAAGAACIFAGKA
jgi:uncharacterized protein